MCGGGAEAGVPELRAAGASMQLGPAAEVWGFDR